MPSVNVKLFYTCKEILEERETAYFSPLIPLPGTPFAKGIVPDETMMTGIWSVVDGENGCYIIEAVFSPGRDAAACVNVNV